MTNTHAMAITETCMSPISQSFADLEVHREPEPSAKTVNKDTDVLDEAVHGQYRNTAVSSQYRDTAVSSQYRDRALSGKYRDTRRFHDASRRLIPSQNSVDTTTDEEKPLVEGERDVTEKAGREKNFKLKPYSPSLEKTVELAMHSKRKHKSKSLEKEKNIGKDLSVRTNFTSTSVKFDDEQNYMVYSPNELEHRGASEPVLYTFPSAADIEAFSSMPSMAVNNYYIEAGIAPPRHKSKSGKVHKADRDKHGRKKHRKLEEHRSRSLPQLEDVYFDNVTQERKYPDGTYQDLYGKQSTPENAGRVFMKRKPLAAQKTVSQPDNAVPLMKMKSLPVVSQSEDSMATGYDEATFISEYM